MVYNNAGYIEGAFSDRSTAPPDVEECPRCAGEGQVYPFPNREPEVCPDCDGLGEIRV